MESALTDLIEQIDGQMNSQIEAQRQAQQSWQEIASPRLDFRGPSRRELFGELLSSPFFGLLILVLAIGALTTAAAGGHGLDYLWIELATFYVAFIQTPFLCRLLD